MGLVRFLLAASVVIGHAPSSVLKLFPGNMAVEIFFIISGFYMSLILSSKYHVSDTRGILDFYASRFLRLWPTFLITTIFIYLLWCASYLYLGRIPTAAGDFRSLVASDAVYVLIEISNLLMIGQDVPSIFHVSDPSGVKLTFGPAETLPDGSLWLGFARNIGQAWSIGTEIWFYLLVPFLVRLPSLWLAFVAAFGLVLRVWMDARGLGVYFFFPVQLPLFIAGMLVQRSAFLTAQVGGYFCLGLVLIGALGFGSLGNWDQNFKWPFYFAISGTMPALFATTQKSSMDRKIGELSYPIYITHMLVLSAASLVAKQIGMHVGGEVLLALVIPVSWALYIYVDGPIGRWRQRFAKPGGEKTQEASPGAQKSSPIL